MADANRISVSDRLHEAYRQGQLRLLVGAGVSVPAGFSTWDRLNERLLAAFLRQDLTHEDSLTWELIADRIPEVAKSLYQVIGRDAVADFVWKREGREDFFRKFAQVFYGGREIADLPVLPLHHEIAAMREAVVFTTNFDPLLELGLALLNPQGPLPPSERAAKIRQYRRSTESGDLKNILSERSLIHHVHGWIDPDGSHGGEFVFTEAQYFELYQEPKIGVNQVLQRLLETEGTVLVLGMSLSDPNLRRMLYWKSRNALSSGAKVVAVMKRTTDLTDAYLKVHWADRGVELLFIQDHKEIPTLLREVRFGKPKPGQPAAWVARSIEWREQRIPQKVMFSDQWQLFAHLALAALRKQLTLLFAVPAEEVLRLTLMLPKKPMELALVVDSHEAMSGEAGRAVAETFTLSLDPGRPEGVASVAFLTGNDFEAQDAPAEVDRNFSAEKHALWYARHGYRSWRSVLCLPLMDTPEWLPVAVISVTSNMANPFWARFGDASDRYEQELYDALLHTARWILTGFVPRSLKRRPARNSKPRPRRS